MASSERARGEGIFGLLLRNSMVGVLGGNKVCSVGMNFNACSFGVGEVWMKTVRRVCWRGFGLWRFMRVAAGRVM